MRVEERLERLLDNSDCFTAGEEQRDVDAIGDEARQAVALLREITDDLSLWLPVDASTKPMVGLDLVDWLKRSRAYLEGGDEAVQAE